MADKTTVRDRLNLSCDDYHILLINERFSNLRHNFLQVKLIELLNKYMNHKLYEDRHTSLLVDTTRCAVISAHSNAHIHKYKKSMLKKEH